MIDRTDPTPAKNILIVDDEDNLRSTLGLILQRAGYEIRAAASAREALECLVAKHFDLIFLDLKMPGMDGMALLPEIRRIDPLVPILILTANASLDTAQETLRLGAYGYLLKPLEPEQILVRVREIISEQEQIARRQRIVDEIKGIVAEINPVET